MRIIIAAVISSMIVAQANAADPCAKPMADAELLQCESKYLAAADMKLNTTYGKLMDLLDAEGKIKLKEAQRAWISFRDANAKFAGDLNRGGTGESLNVVGTKTTMTNDRTKDLQSEIEARQ